MTSELIHDLEYLQKYKYIAGGDEAGRGAWAGPVVTAIVVFDRSISVNAHKEVTDSKKLTPSKREELYAWIIKNSTSYCIKSISNQEIDEKNILEATYQGFREAFNGLLIKPEFLLLDGGLQVSLMEKQKVIIKGDQKSFSIGAASILAKVYRDGLMTKYHGQYPEYRFDKNKGYGTQHHKQSIDEYGILPIHRKTFKPIQKNLK